MKKRPNIIIFNPDQFRADALGHLGNPASVTPNLDKLVEGEAVSFRNAFCQNPVCTPSRCSFMSGWYPHVRGHRTMFHMMHEDEPVLLKTLKENGYFVWWGGKNDLLPGQKPFDDYCDLVYEPDAGKRDRMNSDLHSDQSWRGPEDCDNYYSFYAGKLDGKNPDKRYYDGDWCNIEGAINFINDLPCEQPFCIYLPIGYPHPPYGVEEPWYSMTDRNMVPERIPAPDDWSSKPSLLKGIFERQRLQSWTEERWAELRATYLGMCSRVDHQFGMLVDALKRASVYDDTAVFVFSDHGDFTGDYGLVEKTQNTFQDCLTRVPFIIKPPKGIDVKPGIRDALVELIDFPATVEALTGIIPEHTHFGLSLLPAIEGKTGVHRDAVFCEGGRLHGERHCMEMQSVSNTVPTGLYWPRNSLQILEGPEHGKAVMCRTDRHKYVRRLYEKDELYDLFEDPHEQTNRIDDPAMAGTLALLRERLLTFFFETCDVVPHKTDKR